MSTTHARATHSPLKAILGRLRGLFLGVAGLSMVINLLMLAPTLYMLQIYDRVLASRNTTTLLMLTLLVLGLFALEALLEWVRSRALIRASTSMDLDLGPTVFDAAFRRRLGAGAGSVQQALGDMTQIRQFVTGRGLFAFCDAPWTPIFLLVITLLHPWLGAFGLVAVLLLLTLSWLTERATAARLGTANRLSQQATQQAAQQLENAEVIEAMGMLARLRQRWMQRQRQMLQAQATASERAAHIGAVTRFVRLCGQSGILGVGALLVIDGAITPGAMIAASILLGRALAPVDQAMGSWRGLVQARGAYARLEQLLHEQPEPPRRLSLPRPQGLVQVDQLVVAAPGSRQPLIQGISFGASPGMLVAVVGPSASGKSSLARALVGVWPPRAGTVRLAGADIAQWDKTELGQWIGYLPQDVALFDGTVADNIARMGELNAEQIVRAAQQAGVHEMILRLPQGYDTPLGEHGVALSGGQRQRIGLARALYGDPALIVLDEPNAHLDEAGDAALVSALAQMQRESRTVFIMTHRLNVLKVADTILMLERGQIQAYGPREVVLEMLRTRKRPPGDLTTAPGMGTNPGPEPRPVQAAASARRAHQNTPLEVTPT
jgi:ATP-binding cassette subfamily C exporter for protease/lipase